MVRSVQVVGKGAEFATRPARPQPPTGDAEHPDSLLSLTDGGRMSQPTVARHRDRVFDRADSLLVLGQAANFFGSDYAARTEQGVES